MPRVHTAIAAKDYPAEGIQKGEQYWYWTPYRARRQTSKIQPMPSQVESNPTRSSYMALQEAASLDIDQAATIEDIRDAIENARTEAENIVEELREKASNIEDGFGHETEMSMEFNERADEVEGWASDLTNLDVPDEPRDEPEKPEKDQFVSSVSFQGALENYQVEHKEWQDAVDGWEATVDSFRDDAQTALGEAPEI